MSIRSLEPGTAVGNHVVVRLLGKGGMGEVYLVRHVPTGELRALKVLADEITAKDSAFVQRFVREGEFARTIRHPNLVAVYEVGQDAGTGRHFIAMEYVSGGSVRAAIDRRGRFEVGEAVGVIRQVAYGLAAAHQHGVIHRDIKPDNIMFAEDGTPKLADLGVARFSDDRRQSTVTMDGTVIGTPAYMSPEQMMNAHNVDARADIYSLGIVFFEMLTGVRPNAEDTVVQLLAKAVKGIPIPDVRKLRPEVSAALVQVLNVMCARRPEDRFDSTQTMVDVFERLRREGFDVRLGLRQPRGPYRRLWVTGLSLAVSLAAVCGGVAYDRLCVFTESYADWADRFGVPQGLGRLTREEASCRVGHWRFSYRGRRGLFGARVLRTVTHVNAFGIPVEAGAESFEDRHSRSEYHFAEDGSLAFADRYTPQGRRVRRDVYSGNGNACVDFKFPLVDGSLLSATLDGDAVLTSMDVTKIATDGFEASKTAVRRIRMTRDANGFVLRESFMANDMNVPVRGPQGAFARTYERDESGRVLSVRCLDERDCPQPFVLNVVTRQFVRDPAGRPVVERNLDESGRLVVGTSGWAEKRMEWNAGDGCVREAYYDENGQPTLANDGVAVRKREFDGAGGCTLVSFFDAEDNPVTGNQVFARIRMRYDGRGFLTEERPEDAQGRPIASHWGVYANCYEHDERGLETRRWYLDADGKTCPGRHDAAEKRSSYRQDGTLAEESYYDETGRPCTESGSPWPEKAGMCRRRFLYDENGRHVSYQSFDGSGKLCVDECGICEERMSYDAFGNIARVMFFGPSGEPIVFPLLGCHEMIRTFDEGGRVTSVRFLGADGNPCGYGLGYQHGAARLGGGVRRIDYIYGPKGDLERISYRDDEDRPMVDVNGVANIVRSYDACGLQVEERLTDVDGRPVADRRTGRARTRWVRDGLGRVTGVDGFDAAGLPIRDKRQDALNPLGVFYRCVYDGRGRKCRSWRVDAEGRKIDGTESVILYDKAGRHCGSCYVDAAGNPVNGPRGYSRAEAEYDQFHRLQHILYRRADGKPHVLPRECWGGGFSGFDRRYYPNGSEMWVLHLGEEGKPACYLGKCCGWAQEYDESGRVTVQINLNEEGRVMQDRGGAYGWRLEKGKRMPILQRPELPQAIRDSLQDYFAKTECVTK